MNHSIQYRINISKKAKYYEMRKDNPTAQGLESKEGKSAVLQWVKSRSFHFVCLNWQNYSNKKKFEI